MADGTKAGGDAPRTLFSLGRSGKRKGRTAQASPLEDYPPRHADDSSGDTGVATLEADTELETDQDGSEIVDATDADVPGDDAPEEIDASEDTASEPCPSCSLPLVPGAVFCGECGTRVTSPDAVAPAAVLLDDEVPGEPLPPEAEGSFEVAEPVTGTLEDDDDLVEDEGTAIGESAVFGAFIGAEDETDPEPEAEAELVEEDPEAELVEEEPEAELVEEEPEAELVEEEPEAELVEEDPEAELVEEDPEAELVEEDPEAELVEEDPEAEVADDDGAVVPIAAAATAGAAAAGLAATDPTDAATLESSTTGGSGGSGGGSKKGVWIGAAAAAAAVVLIIGVVALGSGGKSAAKKDDQVAAGTQKSTTTTAAPSTTASTTVTTQAPTTVTETPTTDTSVPDSSTSSTAGATTSTAQHLVGPPPPPPPASPANVQVSCPPNLKPDSTTAITLHNVGGTSTSFLVTWSALKTGVTVSPTTGTVAASSIATILVHVAPGTPGSGSRVTIKWSGGATSCNLLVQ